jgi:16S rRNA (cytosine967-C5)-methyltransferase
VALSEPRSAGAGAGLPARRAAVAAVDAVLRRGRPLDEALDADAATARLDVRDRGFAHALARVTLRRHGQILATLDERLERGLPPRAGALEAILATAAAQLLFMDVPAHAAVDLAVRLARADREAERYAGLANAVLRAVARDARPAAGPAANLPEWLGLRLAAAYGEDVALAIAEAHVAEPPLDLSTKADPDAWAARLGGRRLSTGTVRLAPGHGAVTALAGFEEGAWWVQDAAARLPALALGPVRGRTVLDLCAAPGGKTAALASAGARVTAVDRDPARMARTARNLDRLGLAAEMIVRDVMDLGTDRRFDAVLLDAPCTATGTLRRHPDVAWTRAPEDVGKLAASQRRLLGRAAAFVAPGGRLVYATCSLDPEEGEAHVGPFLAANASFRLDPVRAEEIGGLAEAIAADGTLRTRPDFWPADGGMDGFFVARFRREAH